MKGRRCGGLALVILVSCGAAGKPRPTPLELPRGHVAGAICGAPPRDDDRCSTLRDPFDSRDVDGCPDVMIAYEHRVEDVPAAAAKTLDDLADEMRRNPRIADVQIVVAAAVGEADRKMLDRRVGHVIDALAARGVERKRLSRAYQPGDGTMTFEPFRCADGSCASYGCLRQQ